MFEFNYIHFVWITDAPSKGWIHLRLITSAIFFLQSALSSGRFLETGKQAGFVIQSDSSETYRALISRYQHHSYAYPLIKYLSERMMKSFDFFTGRAFQQHKTNPTGALQVTLLRTSKHLKLHRLIIVKRCLFRF